VARRVVYFPGSTIGNFTPTEADTLLRNVADLCGRGGALLIGVDLKKDVAVLDAAYNDAAGVTARFNLNLLARMNRELGADFDLNGFTHKAVYNDELGRVEMHLISARDQRVQLGNEVISFAAGETIHTENSHKYTIGEFGGMAARSGFRPAGLWTDTDHWFSVQLYEVV
jgi:L-histidine Nalpha-methyltransferase